VTIQFNLQQSHHWGNDSHAIAMTTAVIVIVLSGRINAFEFEMWYFLRYWRYVIFFWNLLLHGTFSLRTGTKKRFASRTINVLVAVQLSTSLHKECTLLLTNGMTMQWSPLHYATESNICKKHLRGTVAVITRLNHTCLCLWVISMQHELCRLIALIHCSL